MLSGQIDMICVLKGESCLTLVDIKTPASPSPTWNLQTAAYRLLAWEELRADISRRFCLMLPKYGGKAKISEYSKHKLDEDEFLKLLGEFRAKKFRERSCLQK